jgi:uroporphyrinogen-III decarboxylase
MGGQDYGGEWAFPRPENKSKRIEYSLNKYKVQMDSLEYMDDDKIPCISPYTGTEIFARAFGCETHYPDDNMPFALPFVNNSKEAAKVKYPDLKSSLPMAEIFDIADKLRDSAPEALMQLPDIQSPFDIAALIWSKEDFFAAMYEDPNGVKELVAMTEKFLMEFLDVWFERYGTEFIAHHPDYYMPRGITFSEDEVGAISPAMFKEFSLGSLNRLSERYGGMAGMHCCANSLHQWESFKEIEHLKLINLNVNQSDEICQKAYKYFEDTCVQMHESNVSDELYFDKQSNKNMRVVIKDWANDKQSAIEKCKKFREKYQ